jgi:hypothetical protein
VELVPGLEHGHHVGSAFTRLAIDGFVQRRIEGFAFGLDFQQADALEGAAELGVDHGHAGEPGQAPQLPREGAPGAIEAVQHRQQGRHQAGGGVLLHLLALELRPAPEVCQLGLGALPAIQIVRRPLLRLLQAQAELVQLALELARLGAPRRRGLRGLALGIGTRPGLGRLALRLPFDYQLRSSPMLEMGIPESRNASCVTTPHTNYESASPVAVSAPYPSPASLAPVGPPNTCTSSVITPET